MATESDIKNWLVNEYGDRDFDQLCQALMWQTCNRFGSAPISYASALDAYYATPIVGYGVPAAGGHSFWDIGAYGHVGFQLRSSGSNEMGTSRTAEDWGWTNRGWQDWATYIAMTGAGDLGWGWSNGANDFDYSDGGGGGGGGSTDYAFGLTTSAQSALQTAMGKQSPAYYSGPVDGEFGENSVKGMQQWLKDMSYLPSDYIVDGIPGPSYGTALQELARDDGVPPYTGPIDGEPGENTSISLEGWAPTTWGTTPPPNPDPDPDPELPEMPVGTVFGVDVATSQGDFNFAEYKAGGGTTAIIKMGGSNASDSPYVAPQYVRQLGNARQQGLNVGHYWFNGRANGLTPTTSADYFVEHMDLEEGDIIAVDIEDEDATSTAHWTPAETKEFIDRVVELLPGAKVLVYMNAGDEAGGDWLAIADAGHPLWIAAWGPNDGTIPGDMPMPSNWAEWSVWQYTSMAGPIPGWADTSLDGNIVTEDLFSQFGYHPEDPEPEPEPEPGEDDALRQLLGEFFQESAELHTKYRSAVDELIADAAATATDHHSGDPMRHSKWRRRRRG